MIGGFVLSGFLVLWVLPALYCALDPRGRLNCHSIEHEHHEHVEHRG